MITPYPPERDGLAAYAVQSVARLRAEGNDVEVLSPLPSAAHHHLDMRGWRGALALARRMRGYDRVVVQFHPDMFFREPCTPTQRARIAAGLALAWRAAPRLEVRVHEIDYTWGRGPGVAARSVRSMWRAVAQITVHTDRERTRFHEAFGVPLSRIHVAAHGQDFMPRTYVTRDMARASLGIHHQDLMFLSLGFIQRHKGFDRAVTAFASLSDVRGRSARLDVVGSVRVEDPAQLAYADELERLVETTPGVHLHTGFVSDEAFDRWIVAADVIVLPYRHIWSSGVLERATLYGRRVIATRVGGLPDQAQPGITLVEDDAELADALRSVATEHGGRVAPRERDEEPWPDGADVDRDKVMQAVRARAERERGGGTLVASSDSRSDQRDVVHRGGSTSRPSAPLRRIPRLALPPAASSRSGVTPVKRAVRRLTAWELEPIVQQVNNLQQAMVDIVERLASGDHDGDAGASKRPPSR
jgi:glycosyltransferase involved in cell wall biosynthesis